MLQIELLVVIGVTFLLFRIWLVEIKLVEELQFRRRYLSRVANYYACLALAFGLQITILNLIVIMALPILLMTLAWDINFFLRFRSRDYWTRNSSWVFIERLTLHAPVILLGLILLFIGVVPYIISSSLLVILIASLMGYTPFFLLDERWKSRYSWPQAPLLILLIGITSVSMVFIQAYFWNVPLW